MTKTLNNRRIEDRLPDGSEWQNRRPNPIPIGSGRVECYFEPQRTVKLNCEFHESTDQECPVHVGSDPARPGEDR